MAIINKICDAQGTYFSCLLNNDEWCDYPPFCPYIKNGGNYQSNCPHNKVITTFHDKMTNRDKAEDLARIEYPDLTDYDSRLIYDPNENDRITFTEGAVKMAEWKDQEFKEYLKEKQKQLKGTDNKKSNHKLLEEIINELYGKC